MRVAMLLNAKLGVGLGCAPVWLPVLVGDSMVVDDCEELGTITVLVLVTVTVVCDVDELGSVADVELDGSRPVYLEPGRSTCLRWSMCWAIASERGPAGR